MYYGTIIIMIIIIINHFPFQKHITVHCSDAVGWMTCKNTAAVITKVSGELLGRRLANSS